MCEKGTLKITSHSCSTLNRTSISPSPKSRKHCEEGGRKTEFLATACDMVIATTDKSAGAICTKHAWHKDNEEGKVPAMKKNCRNGGGERAMGENKNTYLVHICKLAKDLSFKKITIQR